jgi:hypothetical protein
LISTWVGNEFAADGPPSFWYSYEVSGIPLQYLAIAGILVLASPFIFEGRSVSMAERLKRIGLWRWTVLAWATIIFALTRGLATGVVELFADWRDLAVTAVLAAVVGRYLSNKPWRRFIITDLAIAYGLAALIPLARWAAGEGTILFGIRIPLFFGPVLYLASFASIVLLEHWSAGLSAFSKGYAVAIRIGAVSSSMLAVLSFRRTYWLVWGIGLGFIVLRRMRDRQMSRGRLAVTVAVITIMVLGVFAVFGSEAVVSRLDSFRPGSTSEFSATNSDHVNDILDAVDVVITRPIEGIGIGEVYETDRIADWKSDSFDVHNAFVHVWLKFGVLGLIAYSGFHFAWMRAGLTWRSPDTVATHSMFAVGVYLTAETVSTLFATWPYVSFQLAVHHGVILGVMLSLASRTEVAADRGRVAATV